MEFVPLETYWCPQSICISVCRQDRDIEPEDFQRYTVKVKTSLQDCPVQRPPAALLSRHREPPSAARQKVKLNQCIQFILILCNVQDILDSNSQSELRQVQTQDDFYFLSLHLFTSGVFTITLNETKL